MSYDCAAKVLASTLAPLANSWSHNWHWGSSTRLLLPKLTTRKQKKWKLKINSILVLTYFPKTKETGIITWATQQEAKGKKKISRWTTSVSSDGHYYMSSRSWRKLLHGDESFAAKCKASCCRTQCSCSELWQRAWRTVIRSHTKPTVPVRQDLISPGEDASDINSHAIADVSQKH